MLGRRQAPVVFRPNDEPFLVLLEMCEQLELISLAVHDMDHLTITEMLLACLNATHPTSRFAVFPFLDLVTTEVFFTATAPGPFFAPERLDMHDTQGTTLALCVDD